MSDSKKKDQLVEEPDMAGTYSAADYLTWKLDDLVELIRGKIYKMSPSPSTNHQRTARNIARIFDGYFLQRECEYFSAPFDVYLVKKGQSHKQTRNVVQPDLCAICDSYKLKDFGCVGAPDLIVEIISPSTAKKDQIKKFELYAEYGVPEYWIVYPEEWTLQVYLLNNGKFRQEGIYAVDQPFYSKRFPDLKVELTEVFRDVIDKSRP